MPSENIKIASQVKSGTHLPTLLFHKGLFEKLTSGFETRRGEVVYEFFADLYSNHFREF